jgi:hypothetical protein
LEPRGLLLISRLPAGFFFKKPSTRSKLKYDIPANSLFFQANTQINFIKSFLKDDFPHRVSISMVEKHVSFSQPDSDQRQKILRRGKKVFAAASLDLQFNSYPKRASN